MIAALLPACLCHGRAARVAKASSPLYSSLNRNSVQTIKHQAVPFHALRTKTMASSEKEEGPLKPSPLPENATPKDAKKYKSLAVLKEFTTPSGFETCRVVDALQQLYPILFPSVSAAKKVTRKGLVLIDDNIADTTTELSPEQTLKCLTRVAAKAQQDATAAPVKLTVAYEDDHIAAVVKTQGMPTINMGKRKPDQVTASECINYVLTMPAIPGVLRVPQPAHRLDAETGGLLICAKTTTALQHLGRAFAQRRMIKRYRALVRGRLTGCGRVTFPLSGDACETEFRSVAVHESAKCGHVTLVDLWPRTGRTHQLRRHMMMIGHPILGDAKYWRREPVPSAHLPRGLQEVAEGDLAAAPGREHAVLALEESATGAGEGGAIAEDNTLASEPEQTPAAENGLQAEVQEETGEGAGCAKGEPGDTGDVGSGVGVKRARDGGANGGAACVGEDAGSGKGRKWGRVEQEDAMGERMCLWKVECKVLHPVTGHIVQMETEMPELFDAVLKAHGPAK